MMLHVMQREADACQIKASVKMSLHVRVIPPKIYILRIHLTHKTLLFINLTWGSFTNLISP